MTRRAVRSAAITSVDHGRRTRIRTVRAKPGLVHQFLVVLADTDPIIWRRIQVPERYSFWGLHVAIQDAMGWQDYHLHEFTVIRGGEIRRIGIPDEDTPPQRQCEAGWEVRVSSAVGHDALPIRYVYDFGDDWVHVLVHEGTWRAEPRVNYPRCVSGARKCPPEDCGGPHGYVDFLLAIDDRRHPRHREMVEWIGGAFDPDAFAASEVEFDDPGKRWKIAFEER